MALELLPLCQFPPLADRYDAALREAVIFILTRFEALGIVAGGTIIRGNPGPSSDLDIYVIHAAPFRQRLQRWFNGVPAEIFVNPPHQIERYFADERRRGRPTTAHLLATGFVVLDHDPVVERLRQQARDQLAAPPHPSPDDLRWKRYIIGSLVEDAHDVADHDPITASMILNQAVYEMLRYRFWMANRYLPRDKDLLGALHGLDPALAAVARVFFGSADLPERLALVGQMVDRTIQVGGFFEWESEPEAV